MTNLKIVCDQCDKINSRSVVTYNPEDFSPTGRKSILLQFWCEYCNKIQVVRYGFYREGQEVKARIHSHIDPKSVPTPKKQGFGITIRPKTRSK